MKMHYSHSLSSKRIAQIVGTFVVLPLIVLAVVGVFMAKTQHLFERKFHLKMSLSQSHGLEPGSPVLLSGIPIGRVELVDLNDRGTVEVLLQLRSRYQELVREDSQARIAKSGIVVGQTQVEIAMGDPARPALADGAPIQVVEPRDIGELVQEVKPVLESVQRTLLRVEEIAKDVQTIVRTGGQVLAHVEEATRDLPAVVASAHRVVESVERATVSLPELTGSVKKTLGVIEKAAGDVRTVTHKLPAIVDDAQESVQNIKVTTESVKAMGRDLPRLVRTAQTVADDVTTILRGAKRTFPVSVMIKNAGTDTVQEPDDGLLSLRGDQLGR